MREILFRGKRIDNGKWNGEWVEGYVAQSGGTFIICDNGLTYGGFEMFEVAPDTVGEYIGLHDENEKRIFEGDIVRLDNKSPEGSWTAVVEFGNPNHTYSWGYQLRHIGVDEGFNSDILLWVDMEETGATCEVIGNIHDNPELLEV